MRKILVTGGCGFIGSHLVEELLKDSENQIIIIDDFSTTPMSESAFKAEIDSNDRVFIWRWPVAKLLCEPFGTWDEIYHLASVVGPAAVIGKRGGIAWSIISDMVCVAARARDSGAVLVDVSTSEIYGGGVGGLCAEEMTKVIPPKNSARLEYAVGKLAAEIALLNMPDLDVRIVRPFNVTGPRQSGKGGFVLPRFVKQALSGEPLTIFGDGLQQRAFTHVKDIVDGIIRVARQGKPKEVYNIGNPENRMTVGGLASLVLTYTNSSSVRHYIDPKAVYGPLYEDANDKFPDASKAMSELDWHPIRNASRIVQDTIEFFRTHEGFE